MKKYILLPLLLFISFISIDSFAQQIQIQGSATFTLKNIDIDPGEDLNYALESTNSINLDIKKLSKNAYWTVMINKSDLTWDNQVKIYVRRTSGGNGKGSVWGGLSYTVINDLPSTFFTGYNQIGNIDIQYKIEGIDVTMEARDYYTDIVYTLYER